MTSPRSGTHSTTTGGVTEDADTTREASGQLTVTDADAGESSFTADTLTGTTAADNLNGLAGDFDTVRLVIHQPRAGGVKEWACSVADLYAWAGSEAINAYIQWAAQQAQGLWGFKVEIGRAHV